MVIIVVVGMPGSGKEVFLQCALAKGFGHVSMGEVVREFGTENRLESTDRSIGEFATSERQKHGDSVWAERTIERLPVGNAVIDGSRSIEEIDFFRKRLGKDIQVVAIRASQELRFHRLKLRQRDDAPITLDDFIMRENREMSWGIGRAIESADITIENEGGLDEFQVRCQAILNNILAMRRESI